ncbi:MAG: hypothetical protein PVI74_10335, partial [Syntrophobacterales bacterium]
PGVPATCKACGKKVGGPYTSMITALPLGIAFIAASFIEPLVVKALLVTAGFLVTCVIHMRWSPLEPR